MLSIITTTWNRAEYLPRVWAALRRQTDLDFEWIVADDGSTDGTEGAVKDLARRSLFPIIYLKASAHVGKARMDNEAVRKASGDLLVWCDSDDILMPEVVERMASEELPADFLGIAALATTKWGLTTKTPDVSESRWNDIAKVHGITGDFFLAVRRELVLEAPFPEVDLVVPESAVWATLGDRFVRFLPEVLMIKEYHSPNAISFNGRMAYSRGRAYAAAIVSNSVGRWEWRTLVNFVRYCIHGEIGLGEARKLWGGKVFWSILPLATALAVKDGLQRKVDKTHREFLANRNAEVRTEILN